MEIPCPFTSIESCALNRENHQPDALRPSTVRNELWSMQSHVAAVDGELGEEGEGGGKGREDIEWKDIQKRERRTDEEGSSEQPREEEPCRRTRPREGQKYRKRGPTKRHHWKDDSMEHSGIMLRQPKRQQTMEHDGALLCMTPQPLNDDSPSEKVGKELARCLHEPKHNLVKDVVEVIGTERALQVFRETAQIQESGGVLSADRDKKRAPGGVFFSLVRSNVSEEEKKRIFRKDKTLTAKRNKDAKRRQWKAQLAKREREVEERAQRELERFRRELGQASDGGVACGSGHHPPDRNMEKRWRRGRRDGEEQDYVDLDDPSNELAEEGEIVEERRERESFEKRGRSSVFERLGRLTEGRVGKEGEVEEVREGGEEGELEEMEMESSDVSGTAAQQLEGFSERSKGREGRRGEVGRGEAARDENDGALEERIAAEQFESMNECDLDFGIELNYS